MDNNNANGVKDNRNGGELFKIASIRCCCVYFLYVYFGVCVCIFALFFHFEIIVLVAAAIVVVCFY